MPSLSKLDRHTIADVRSLIARSRVTLAVILSLVLLVGVVILRIGEGRAVWEGIGASLVASAVVSLATVWIDFIRSGEQLRADRLLDAGLRDVFKVRSLDTEYDQYLAEFNEIDVCGYTLTAFTESNEVRFHEMQRSGKDFRVRMLLVDPRIEAATLLEEGENKPAGTYVRAFESIRQKLAGLDGRIELRLLRRPLSMMVYRIDDVLYTGPYPCVGASRNALTIKLAGGWLFERQRAEFDALWNLGIVQPLA